LVKVGDLSDYLGVQGLVILALLPQGRFGVRVNHSPSPSRKQASAQRRVLYSSEAIFNYLNALNFRPRKP